MEVRTHTQTLSPSTPTPPKPHDANSSLVQRGAHERQLQSQLAASHAAQSELTASVAQLEGAAFALKEELQVQMEAAEEVSWWCSTRPSCTGCVWAHHSNRRCLALPLTLSGCTTEPRAGGRAGPGVRQFGARSEQARTAARGARGCPLGSVTG